MVIEALLFCIAFPAAATGIVVCLCVAGSAGSMFCALIGAIIAVVMTMAVIMAEIRRNWKISTPEQQQNTLISIGVFFAMIVTVFLLIAWELMRKERERAAVKTLVSEVNKNVAPETEKRVITEAFINARKSPRLAAN